MGQPYDIHFHFDPVCPFAWLTSRWVQKVVEQRDHRVDWRFISLRQLNAHLDYDTHFPEGYDAGHTAGLRLLRVCASVRSAAGRDAIGPLYTAFGTNVFDRPPMEGGVGAVAELATRDAVAPILAELGHDPAHADALDDAGFDTEIQAETDEALARTGKDVGTPIIVYRPPDGPAFFGPVISTVPSDEDAVALWDAVLTLTSYTGFAELKRSLRSIPALRVYGQDPDAVGELQDWEAGRVAAHVPTGD